MARGRPLGAVARAIGSAALCGAVFLTFQAAALAAPRRAPEPVFVVANWEDYGSDAPWVVRYFEKTYHCIIRPVYYDSEEQALNILRTGGVGKVDVILPNLEYVRPAAQEGLLQPIDVSRLPNYKDLYPTLQSQPYDRLDGKVYGVPWMWGTTGLAYNTKVVKTRLDSWAALWNPKFKGRIGFYSDPTTAIMIAALYLGENPYHPNLAKVKAALIRQKALDRLYWTSASDWQHAFQSGAIVVGSLWSGLAGTDYGDKWPIAYVIPKQGAVGWVDNWAIVKDAPQQRLAYDWINYMISLQFQERYAYDLAQEPPAPSNRLVASHLSAKIKDIIGLHPSWLPHLILQRAMPAAQLAQWTDLFQAVESE
jgi:spermidine/putrescine transport system substrate-binding protein